MRSRQGFPPNRVIRNRLFEPVDAIAKIIDSIQRSLTYSEENADALVNYSRGCWGRVSQSVVVGLS